MEILKVCVPIVVGALIAIIPSLVEKSFDRKNDENKITHKEKQDLYVELISLLGTVLKNHHESESLRRLQNRINLVSITGSVDVVKTLNEYLDSWGEESSVVQNEKYRNLLKAMRVDLGVDKTMSSDFPNIGLRDINVIR